MGLRQNLPEVSADASRRDWGDVPRIRFCDVTSHRLPPPLTLAVSRVPSLFAPRPSLPWRPLLHLMPSKDKNKSEDAAQNFRLVSEAYRILTSPDSKLQYDRTHRYSIETPPSNGCDRASGYGGGSRGTSRTTRGHRREEESFKCSGGRAYGSSNARGGHRSRTQPAAW